MQGKTTTAQAKLRFQWSSSLDRAFDGLMYLFIFITVFLPSGSIYGLNFKAPLYVVLLPLAAYSVFRRGQAAPGRLALVIGVPALLFIWVVIGLSYGFPLSGAIRQYADIVLTLLLCWLAVVYCGGRESRRIAFLHLVLNAEIATAILKVGLIAYALLRGIPVVEMVLLLSKIFGVNLMSMDLGAMLGRVQFFSDALIPVCIFIILRHRDRMKIGNLRAAASILLLLISVLFSFSRYLWAFSALAFLVGLLLGRQDRFQAILFLVLGASVIASLPVLAKLYELRFAQAVAGSSDLQRTEQIHALKAFLLDAPLVGHGLGSYTTQVLREQDTEAGRYSYEVQLLALSAQIGLLGMFLLVALGAFYYSDLWWNSSLSVSDRLGIGLLLGFWIAAGLYNPLLFHPIAGVNYAAFATLAGIKSKQHVLAPAKLYV